MCLGVPGKVLKVEPDEHGVPMGTVSFGGVKKEVCFACLPDAAAGEYVVVHVGFAISRIGEAEAAEVFALLTRMGQLEELERGPREAEA
jgi:hydrogenase expression/formation protein HypC